MSDAKLSTMLSALTVAQLKDMCRRSNLPVSGVKQDLLDRLARHAASASEAPQPPQPPQPPARKPKAPKPSTTTVAKAVPIARVEPLPNPEAYTHAEIHAEIHAQPLEIPVSAVQIAASSSMITHAGSRPVALGKMKKEPPSRVASKEGAVEMHATKKTTAPKLKAAPKQPGPAKEVKVKKMKAKATAAAAASVFYIVSSSSGYFPDDFHSYQQPERKQNWGLFKTVAEANAKAREVFYDQNPWGSRDCMLRNGRDLFQRENEAGLVCLSINAGDGKYWTVESSPAAAGIPARPQSSSKPIERAKRYDLPPGFVRKAAPAVDYLQPAKKAAPHRKPTASGKTSAGKSSQNYYIVSSSTGYHPQGFHSYQQPEEHNWGVFKTVAKANAKAREVFYEQNPWGWSKESFDDYGEDMSEDTDAAGLVSLSVDAGEGEYWSVEVSSANTVHGDRSQPQREVECDENTSPYDLLSFAI